MSWFDRTRKRAPAAQPKPATLAPMESAGRETRPAAGFSLLELERAGLSEAEAEQKGLVIDRKRRSALGMNVAQLLELTRSNALTESNAKVQRGKGTKKTGRDQQ